MPFCPSCGEKLVENALFCSTCGKSTMMPVAPLSIPKPKKRWLKALVGGIIAFVVVFMVLAIIISYLSNTGITSPTEPVRHAYVTVAVSNDDWYGSRSCSVYIDGDLKETYSIAAMSLHEFSLDVSWRGSTLHNAEVKVYSSGSTQTKTVTVQDGGSVDVTFGI